MLFGVFVPDHVGSSYLAWLAEPRFLGHHSAVEAERLFSLLSVTYGFHVLLRNQSVGITIQIFELQLDWSHRILPLQKFSISLKIIDLIVR